MAGGRRPRLGLRTPAILAGLLLTQAIATPTLHAEFAYLSPLKDSTLIESPTGTLANGSGPAVFAGRNNSSVDSKRRTLLAFDVTGRIPAGSTITLATLRLGMTSTSGGAVPVALHRVLADWGEGPSSASGGGGAPAQFGDSTWLHRFYDGELWGVPGGDFASIPIATTVVDQVGPYSWGSTPEMVADVQSWLDGTAINLGWMLVGDETRPQTVKRFESRESPDERNRPLLYVEYVPPCAPSPLGPGAWSQRCAGLPGQGAGNGEPWTHPGMAEPGFAERILPCAGEVFSDLGLAGEDACEALSLDPPRSCEERAIRKLSVLILNVCAGRLQTSCPVDAAGEGCFSPNVGDLLREMATRILAGDCRSAAGCAADLDHLP